MAVGIQRLGTNVAALFSDSVPSHTVSHTLESALGGNRLVVVEVIWSTTSGNPSISGVTYGGVAMTESPSGNINVAGAGRRLQAYLWYILEADLPADGARDAVVTFSGTGTGKEGHIGISSFSNIAQIAPEEYTAVGLSSATAINASISKPIDHFFVGAVGVLTIDSDITHDNTQVEWFEGSTSFGTEAFVDTIDPVASVIGFTSTRADSADKIVKVGAMWDVEPDPSVYFETTIAVQSAVTANFITPTFFATNGNIVATSTASASLHRNRGYVTTVTVAPSTVIPTLVRQVDFFGSLTESATVVSPTFMKDSALSTVINPIATASGLFGATRPLMSTTNVVSVITPQFGSDFNETTTSLTPGEYVELFEIDTTVIGGGDIFRFIPMGYESVEFVEWQGEQFRRFPIVVDGFEWNATSQAPPQPTLQLSNVNKFVLAAVISLGDLVGAKVTRWRTYAKFLDLGETPDPNAHFPADIYFIQQKSAHTKQMMEWKLSSALDLPGIRLPRRQILKDQTTGNLYAPGVSSIRFKGR
jgi:lambda family phage minor tail protein L